MPTALFWMIVPAALARVVGTVDVIIGAVVSAVVVGAGCYVLAEAAAHSGQPFGSYCARLLGRRGAILATIALALSGLFFAALEGSIIAFALSTFVGGPIHLWYLVVVLVGAPMVIGGVTTWLDKLNGVLLPLFVIGLVSAVVMAINAYGYSSGWLTQSGAAADLPGPGWMLVVSTNLALPTVLFAWEFARSGRVEDARINGLVTFGVPFWLVTFLVNALVGIFLVAVVPGLTEVSETALVPALLALMGGLGVAFIWVTQTRINTANYFVASRNLQLALGDLTGLTLPTWVWVIIAGALTYLAMAANLLSYILVALGIQGIFVCSLGAILVTHLVRQRIRQGAAAAAAVPNGIRSFEPVGLVPWALAVAVGVVMTVTHVNGAAIWTIPAVYAVSIVGYLCMTTFTERKEASLSPIPESMAADGLVDPQRQG